MIRERVIKELRDAAELHASIAQGSTWYIFGSVDRDEDSASDIDLLVICIDDNQADSLRSAIDADAFSRPLDLSLMTYAEESEVGAIALQRARQIVP